MSNLAIEITGLGKCYKLHRNRAPTLFTERLGNFLRKPSSIFGSNNADTSEEFWAVRDVSLAVDHGEVLGIIGRNGAGKSTLLKILSRITEPSTGRIAIHGRVASLLEVGTGFHPELTGRENIFLNGAILGMTKAEISRKFDEIVAFAEVERFLSTPVKHYSSGMYVRLAFAVAAHLEPEILIVDEVLAVGDAQFQRKCLGKMQSVARESGRTVLFVSHNMGAVRSLCKRVVWMERGQVKMSGDTNHVVAQFLNDAENPESLAADLSGRKDLVDKKLFLTKVRINRGKPPTHGEPLQVELDYVSRASEPEVSFGIGFSNLDGTRLMSLDSDLGGVKHEIPQGKSGTIIMEVPTLQLQPGHYFLDVGIRSGDYHGLDYAPSVLRLEVFPGPRTPAGIIRSDGGVRIMADWSGFP